MTWSIIARDEATQRTGIVVATKFFAVGALVPHIKTGVGAIASQAFINPHFGSRGLQLLETGLSAETVIARLVAEEEGRANRQLHMMDREGKFAAYTGAACIDWCGHERGAGYSVAGNMLAGPAVLAETSRAYERSAMLPFAQRLIAAMQAGEAAGGHRGPVEGLAVARITRSTTCASTTTLTPCRSWRDWRRLRASASCISGASCRAVSIPQGWSIAGNLRILSPNRLPRTTSERGSAA